MSTVQRWERALAESGLDAGEIAERTGVLDGFCAFAAMEPDDVVEACVDRERGKIVARERRKIEDLIDEFARTSGDGTARGTTARANIVRSFLIHNGVRVLAPKAPWL